MSPHHSHVHLCSGRKSRRAGFTLVELLTVIAIIGILAAIIIPVTSRVREQARRATCASNLRQVAAATLLYAGDNRGMMPLVFQNAPGDDSRWAMQIQKYVSSAGAQTIEAESIFICPSDDVVRTASAANLSTPCSYGLSVYVHINGIATNTTRKPFAIIPSPSRAILYGEVWNAENTVRHSLSTGAGESFLADYHDGDGANYAFADGHVEFLTKAAVIADNKRLMLGIPLK